MANWAEQFREFYTKQGKNLSQVAGELGWPRSTLGDILRGTNQLSNSRREALYAYSRLEILKEPIEQIPKETPKPSHLVPDSSIDSSRLEADYDDLENLAQALLIKASQIRGPRREPSREEYSRYVREASDALYVLFDKLEPFKNPNVSHDKLREDLTRAIPGNDIGYITALLNAIYKPETFRNWVLQSNYIPRGSRK